ncbi:DcaP family trimeric outer membrane transporter [Elizabethkingia anophelis]|uniref:DcaP family trimeric outer membrane transporter n=1 Tax=Elizabethkingia anophelis TaxID=1117645 RepID=UPI0038927C10
MVNYNKRKKERELLFFWVFIILCVFFSLSYAQEKEHDSLITNQLETNREVNKLWQFKFSGFVQADYMFDSQQMQSKDGFVSPLIDLPQNNSGSSYFSIRQSQLRVEVQNPKLKISGKVEIDFYGANNTSAPRLRQAYFTWKNLMFGQTWSNFSDVDTWSELLDFVGPNGAMSTRQVQVRYTARIRPNSLLTFSLEDPDGPSITFPKDSLEWKKKALLPSFTTAYRYGDTRNYIRIAGILSPISYESKNTNEIVTQAVTKTTLGIGANLSGAYYLNTRDNIKFQTSYGMGIATNNITLHNMGYDLVANRNGKLERLPMFNILLMYEHWWSSALSSTVYLSDSKFLRRAFLPRESLNSFQNAGANIIYHPEAYLRIGLECTYGGVENVERVVANAMRYQLSTSFTF